MTVISTVKHETKKNTFEIEVHYAVLQTDLVNVDKSKFDFLCHSGCRNYNHKYSCPPHSPNFEILKKKYKYLHAIFYKINLEPYPQIYNTIRMANVVAKSKQRKMMDLISASLTNQKERFVALENGSCRLCKKCALLAKEKCKHPHKMRYSLEATGVNVNDLCLNCFKMPLQWYRKGKKQYPDYQGVVSGVLCDFDSALSSLIKAEISRSNK